MGQASHTDVQALIREAGRTSRPPDIVAGRRCTAIRTIPGRWVAPQDRHGFRIKQSPSEWQPPTEVSCEMGCSIWVPELEYCAHHLPIEWLVVANARGELWARLLPDLWEQVRAEYPAP